MYKDNLEKAYKYIRSKISQKPILGIILGTGLNNIISDFHSEISISFSEIPNFPKPTIKEHQGIFEFGTYKGEPIVIQKGRIHFYEGYDIEEVTCTINIMSMLGVKTLIITNSAGAISESINVGDIVLIRDHISSLFPNPLRMTKNNTISFLDTNNIYDLGLRKKILNNLIDLSFNVKTGIYLQTIGPNFETPAEINAFKILGADIVGMSTACEATVAANLGIKVIGISFVSNKAAGLTTSAISFEEVLLNTQKNFTYYSEFIKTIIPFVLKECVYENTALQR